MRRIYCLLLLVFLGACTKKPATDPATNFDQDLKDLQSYFHIPGIACLVVRDGETIYENYLGYADLAQQKPVDSSTLFPIASITKFFAATLVMHFVEAGELDLDDSINAFLDHSDLSDSIKVKHVLSHTSEGVPGSFFNYSPRYGLLTNVLEKVSGKSFTQLIDEKILQPQSLNQTVPITSQETLDSLDGIIAKPYYFYGETEDGHFDIGLSASSGLASTVRDLAAFDAALSKNELISSEVKNQMSQPFPTTLGTSPYGLGIFTQKFMNQPLVWGFGQEDCYSSLLLKVPEQNLTLVLLANNNLMSDPARLINGDLTYSLFALSFLKHFVFNIQETEELSQIDEKRLIELLKNKEHAIFYRQELLANALAASFMGHGFSGEFEKASRLTQLAIDHFPAYTAYGNQSMLRLLNVLTTTANYPALNEPMEKLGQALIAKNPLDPYANIYLAYYYSSIGKDEEAFTHFKTLADAQGLRPFWYTIEALDYMGDYCKLDHPSLARQYFQRIVDIGWDMGGKLDKAKEELKELSPEL